MKFRISIFVLIGLFSILTQLEASYLDVNVCAYRPNDEVLRDTYSNTWVSYQFTLDAPVRKNFYFWGGIGVQFEDGSSSENSCVDTWYRSVPITIGAKYYLPCNCFQFFGGLGFRYFTARIVDCCFEGSDNNVTSQAAVGGAAVVGTRFCLNDRLSVNAFVDYSFNGEIESSVVNGVSIETTTLDLSGLLIGVGLSFCF